MSGSGISWVTTQFFTGRMPFLPPNQQRQTLEGICINKQSLDVVHNMHHVVHNRHQAMSVMDKMQVLVWTQLTVTLALTLN